MYTWLCFVVYLMRSSLDTFSLNHKISLQNTLWNENQDISSCPRDIHWIVYLLIHSLIYPFSVDPCKYFGCELGAQTLMDPKTGRYIINGQHESVKLQELLDGFIKNFVLCEQCDNPETLIVSKIWWHTVALKKFSIPYSFYIRSMKIIV